MCYESEAPLSTSMTRAGSLITLLLGVTTAVFSQQHDLREAARLDSLGECDRAAVIYRSILAGGAPTQPLLNNAGNHFVKCGDPDEARSLFAKLLSINPAHQNANLQTATLELDRGNPRGALEHLRRVQDTGTAVMMLRAEAHHRAGEKHEAAEILRRTESEISDPKLLLVFGNLLEKVGFFDRAELAFSRLLTQQPNDPAVLYRLGRSAARAGHLDRAEHTLSLAVKLRPEDVESLLELGRVYATQQDFTRSVYILSNAKARAPNRPEILLALARAAEDAGFYGDAAIAWDEYLRLNPKNESAQRDRAIAHGLAGSSEAVPILDEFVRNHPGDPAAWFGLARLTWTENPDRALESLNKSLGLDSSSAPAHFAKAWLLHRAGRVADAVIDLQAALKIEPENVRVMAQLGLEWLTLDRLPEAERILRKALSKAPDDPAVLLHLGRCLIAKDRAEEAEPYLERYQKLRSQTSRSPRAEPGMIELATIAPQQRAQREIARLSREAEAHPGDLEFRLQLGIVLVLDGKRGEGVQEFTNLLHRNPDASLARRAGTFLTGVKEYALAADFLRRIADVDSSAALDMAFAISQIEGAGAALKTLDSIGPAQQTGDYYLLRATLADALGDRDDVAAVLKKAEGKVIERPNLACGAVPLLVTNGLPQQALDVLNGFAQLHYSGADILTLKAATLALLGRTKEAMEVAHSVQAQWPEWSRAYAIEALILAQTGHPVAARKSAQTAAALAPGDRDLECMLADPLGLKDRLTQCGGLDSLTVFLRSASCSNR